MEIFTTFSTTNHWKILHALQIKITANQSLLIVFYLFVVWITYQAYILQDCLVVLEAVVQNFLFQPF